MSFRRILGTGDDQTEVFKRKYFFSFLWLRKYRIRVGQKMYRGNSLYFWKYLRLCTVDCQGICREFFFGLNGILASSCTIIVKVVLIDRSSFMLEAESIEWFIEDQAFSMKYALAPPPPPLPPSASSTGDTQEEWEIETTCWRDRGRGVMKETNH